MKMRRTATKQNTKRANDRNEIGKDLLNLPNPRDLIVKTFIMLLTDKMTRECLQ
jgi:hypothetical protein